MDQVADGLYVGTTEDATNGSALEFHNVTTTISLTHDTPNPTPHHLSVHSILLIDGPQANREQFTEAVEDTAATKTADETVLVHCSAGASRSPTVAATALALTEVRYFPTEISAAILNPAELMNPTAAAG